MAIPAANAGNGLIKQDGTIDLTVSVRFPPTAAQLGEIINHCNRASEILWDATDGQLRFGLITLVGGTSNNASEDAADVWFSARGGASTAPLFEVGVQNNGQGTLGKHIDMKFPDLLTGGRPVGMVLAHEFAHYGFGMSDEYDEQIRFGKPCGIGGCMKMDYLATDVDNNLIDDITGDFITNEVNHCLMQSTNPLAANATLTEFCTAANHDMVKGNAVECPDLTSNGVDNDGDGATDDTGGNPFANPENNTSNGIDDDGDGFTDEKAVFGGTEIRASDGVDDDRDGVTDDGHPAAMPESNCNEGDACLRYSTVTGFFETTLQEERSGQSCWSTLAGNVPWLAAPNLPAIAAPGGFAFPQYVNNINVVDSVVLVLDRSGSMNKSTWHDLFEACNNGADDDNDDVIDEDGVVDGVVQCTQTRMRYLKAAARAFLDLANGQGVNVGITSFNGDFEILTEDGMAVVDAANVGSLKEKVESLESAGGTAMGFALKKATEYIVEQDPGAASKTLFMVSDGKNTVGPHPVSELANVEAAGVRVFTVSTGEASNDGTLAQISGFADGEHFDEPDGAELVPTFVQMWARYRNGGIIIPKLEYAVDAGAKEIGISGLKDASNWVEGDEDVTNGQAQQFPLNNIFEVEIDAGTGMVQFVLAGNMANMDKFGVHMALISPDGEEFQSEKDDTEKFRVIRDKFYVVVEIRGPAPGTWFLDVRGNANAARIQTGNLTVISDNPRVDVFTDLDRHVVEDTTKPVRLDITPIYSSVLRNVNDIQVNVIWPNGEVHGVLVKDEFKDGGDYAALIDAMPFTGMYQVRVRLRTNDATTVDLGETMFADAMSNAKPLRVPTFERTMVHNFFVPRGQKDPGPTDGDDDGKNESEDEDNDRDPRVPFDPKLPELPFDPRNPLPDLCNPGIGPDPLPDFGQNPGLRNGPLDAAPQQVGPNGEAPAPMCGAGAGGAAPMLMFGLGFMGMGQLLPRRRRKPFIS
jgi:uncharacterized protein YegL